MPILHVEVVGDPRDFPPDLAQRLADTAGSALNSRPHGTWVKLQFIAATAYAENGGALEGRPILVSLIQADPPAGEALKAQVAELSRAIALEANTAIDNVHVIVEPAAKGRVAFGGKLVE